MDTNITITSITGISPYDVYVCDTGYTTCIYVSTIVPAQLPYQFQLPFVQEGMNPIGLKIVDNTGCVVQETLVI